MEQNTKKQERRLEMVFLLAVFLTILMWAMVQPFNASPDAAMRYQIVDYIMRHGKLPVGYEAEIRDPNCVRKTFPDYFERLAGVVEKE